MSSETILTINCDLDFAETLSLWKKACMNKYGHGGIKKRVQELVGKDLKILEGMK